MKLLLLLLVIKVYFSLKAAPISTDDGDYRQANVPPLVTLLFDNPAYSKEDLFKWTDFVEGNLQIQKEKRMETDNNAHNLRKNTFKSLLGNK